MEEMLIRANNFTRVFKCQMNNFLKSSIASDGWEMLAHVREYGFRNPRKFYSRNPEYSLRNPKSHLRLEFRIQNRDSQIPVPLTAKTGIDCLDYGIHSVESRVPKTILDRTLTQSLLCMRCDLWEGFSEFAVHQGKDGRKTPNFCHFSSLLPKRVKFPFHIPLRE